MLIFSYLNAFRLSNAPAPIPDHKAVFVNVDIVETQRGPGYCKLNLSVLKDEAYINGVNELIDKTLNDYEDVGKKLVW